jgi:hypothetical protein
LLVGAAMDGIKTLPHFTLWVPRIERGSGIVLLLAAVYFLYLSGAYAGLLTPLPWMF